MKFLLSFFIFLPSLFYLIGPSNQLQGLITPAEKELCLKKMGLQLLSLGWAGQPAFAQTQGPPKSTDGFSGKVSGVLSGHLLMVQEGDKTHRVYLYGILSPSQGAGRGKKSRGFLEEIAFGRLVRVEPVAPVEPKRIYALVYLEGRNLNEEMLRQGLAWVNSNACLLNVCENWKALEKQAQEAKKGIWSDPTGATPWEKEAGKSRKKKRSD